MLAVLGGTSLGISLLTKPSDSFSTPQPAAAANTWPSLQVPWISDGQLHFAANSVERPGDLTSIAATADAAICLVGDPGSQNQLYELSAGGSAQQVGASLTGIPIADPASHLVAWVELRADGSVQGVAYDTEAERVSGTVELNSQEQVYAVDGSKVVIADGKDSYSWIPDGASDHALLTPIRHGAFGWLVTDTTPTLTFATDMETSKLLAPDGPAIKQFDEPVGGTFDAGGGYLAVQGAGSNDSPLAIVDTANGQTTTLEGIQGYASWSRWAPDGMLIVRTQPDFDGISSPDSIVQYFSCLPSSGACQQIDGSDNRAGYADGYESSAFGQIAATVL